MRSESGDVRASARFLAVGVRGLAVTLAVVVLGGEQPPAAAADSLRLGARLLETVVGPGTAGMLRHKARVSLEDRIRALLAGEQTRYVAPADQWQLAENAGEQLRVAARRVDDLRYAASMQKGSAQRRTPVTQTDGETRELRDLATRGTTIGTRLQGLEQAVAAGRGVLDDGLLDETVATVERATARLRLSAHHTVVAIAGATGSGKSSTYNALTGLELSSTGVRRPTTSWATACVWGSEGAEEVLDWLGIPPRHQTMRDSMLDTKQGDEALAGVVLMDLPDHDSTEVSHHLEVDRLVELADLLVWVVDPQKYADAALHDRYLAPYQTHAGVMLVVLNHIDTIAPEKRQGMVDDVKRLLANDGLASVKVIPISAREGIGVDELRQEIASRVEQKRSTTARVEADVAAAAARLDSAGGDAPARQITDQRAHALVDRVAEAAGVPTVAGAVERTVRSRAGRAVAWPPVAAISGSRSPRFRRHAGRLPRRLAAAGRGRAARGRRQQRA